MNILISGGSGNLEKYICQVFADKLGCLRHHAAPGGPRQCTFKKDA